MIETEIEEQIVAVVAGIVIVVGCYRTTAVAVGLPQRIFVALLKRVVAPVVVVIVLAEPKKRDFMNE